MYQLDGPKFMRMARRMSAYEGVMRLRLEAEEAERRQRTGTPSYTGSTAAYRPAAVGAGAGVRHVSDVELELSPEFAGLADWVRV